MSESNANLWAPWRMEYIEQLGDGGQGCFLCRYWAEAQRDVENLVLWRTDSSMVLMNRFPYTGGHLLIAPGAHTAGLAELSDDEMLELMRLTRDSQRLLDHVVGAQGYNIGMNFGRCAGAGLPDHQHVHVVPRWSGDTNFMAVLGKTRVIPEALQKMYDRLRQATAELGLPYRVASR